MRTALDIEKLKNVYSRVSQHYDLQHGVLTAFSDQRGRRLLVNTTVKAGDKVLDAGGGTGSTALLAAEKTGETGHVTLFDLSTDMLKIARQKAQEAGLAERMKFESGDMLNLPYADNSFDCVLSAYSLCPLYEPLRGVKELLRVLKKGGMFGAAHSTEPANPVVRLAAEVVENVVWKIPSLSMGCRAVNVLPELQAEGYELVLSKRIGVPLWPFQVFVIKK